MVFVDVGVAAVDAVAVVAVVVADASGAVVIVVVADGVPVAGVYAEAGVHVVGVVAVDATCTVYVVAFEVDVAEAVAVIAGVAVDFAVVSFGEKQVMVSWSAEKPHHASGAAVTW